MLRWKSMGALTTLFFTVFLLQACLEREEVPKVRLWALAPPEVTSIEREGLPPLRLAVALTISPQDGYQLYRDFTEVLGQKLNHPVHLTLRRSLSEVNDLVRSLQADLAQLCARGFLQGRTDFGLTALAVPEVKKRESYPSYVIVSAESEVVSLTDLETKTLAFADPLCAPELLLAGRRYRLGDSLFARRLTVTSHDRAVRAVGEKLVDGALVDGLVYARMALTDPDKTQKTKVIGETAPYINPPIAVHPRMEPKLRENVRKNLLTFHQNERGRAVLARLGADRFVTPARATIRPSGHVRAGEEAK